MYSVFLGGTCNGSNWRDELISMLDTNKINAFNPVVDNWDKQAQENEDYHKENDDYCLYVITPEMVGIYSIFEVGMDSIRKKGKVLFCALDNRNGKEFDSIIKRNIEKIKKDLTLNETLVFDSLEQIAFYLNNLEDKRVL